MSQEQQAQAQRFRWLATRVPDASSRRLVVLTGARQTGKTTLARTVWPDLDYCSLDDADERDGLRQVSASGWAKTVGPAILDEAQ